MPWVKRNLGLVIGGVVALALMGLAVYYLWTKMQEDQAVSVELETATARFTELVSRPVHPGNEQVNNIERAKEEYKKLEQLLTIVQAKVGSNQLPKSLSDRDFRALLDNTITELQRDAEKLGVALPDKEYWFTFSPHKTSVEFKSIDMLTHQLMDVKTLADVLYRAKVHDLVGLKRVPASSDDNNANDFLGDKKPATNEFAIVTPYELTFQGFSSELAKVIEGLINSKQCFVVRSVAVAKASDQPAALPMAMPSPYMMNPAMLRYGRGYMPPPVQQPLAPLRRPGNVLLDEEKLRFVLMVDAVRLKPASDQKMAQATIDPATGQVQ